MQTKHLFQKQHWPSFDVDEGWLDKLYKVPYDELFTRELTTPAANISEKNSSYLFDIAAPGLSKEDFKVELTKDMLRISANKKNEEKAATSYCKREYNYTNWTRSFTLPKDIDTNKISAEYINGELKISLPKNGGMKTINVRKIAVS
jgi:HSP20 family protein